MKLWTLAYAVDIVLFAMAKIGMKEFGKNYVYKEYMVKVERTKVMMYLEREVKKGVRMELEDKKTWRGERILLLEV